MAVDWIYMTHYTVQLRSLVSTALNLLVPYKAENFLTSCFHAVSSSTLDLGPMLIVGSLTFGSKYICR